MLAAFVLLVASPALLKIEPQQIRLTKDAQKAVVSLQNPGRVAVRLVATVWAWSQGADGETHLDPTGEMSVEPAEFIVPPRGRLTLELQTAAFAGAVERAFRLELDEQPLQPFARTEHDPSHLSIPIFISREAVQPDPQVTGLSVQDGHARFRLVNRGDGHFLAENVTVGLIGHHGERLALQRVPSWYVLAGGEQTYDVPLAARPCSRARKVVVTLEARGAQAKVAADAALPEGACAVP